MRRYGNGGNKGDVRLVVKKKKMTSFSDSWDLYQDGGVCPKRQVKH